jgi:Protein of unknown function (DUF2800)
MIDNERLDLDSASSAYRRRRCRGSANLVRALRQAGQLREERNPDAESGTRVHQAWCGQKAELSPRETDTLESLKRMEAMLVTDWAAGQGYVLLGREQRLWLHQALEPVHSGAFDVAYGTLDRILIIDGKTLFGEVTPAEENDQLRELVGLARANFRRCTQFTVAILQPWVSSRPSIAVYDEAEAELALRELRATIRDCADPDAPRLAGVWCDKCPAFTFCDEPKRLTARTKDLAKQIAEGNFALPLGTKGAQLLDAIKLAQDWLDAIWKRYKTIVAEQPDAIPGWYLKDGRKVRKIADLSKALAIAEGFMTREEFFKAANVSVTALEELCKKPSGLRGRALSDYFNQKFADVIEVSHAEPVLAPEKQRTLAP